MIINCLEKRPVPISTNLVIVGELILPVVLLVFFFVESLMLSKNHEVHFLFAQFIKVVTHVIFYRNSKTTSYMIHIACIMLYFIYAFVFGNGRLLRVG